MANNNDPGHEHEHHHHNDPSPINFILLIVLILLIIGLGAYFIRGGNNAEDGTTDIEIEVPGQQQFEGGQE